MTTVKTTAHLNNFVLFDVHDRMLGDAWETVPREIRLALQIRLCLIIISAHRAAILREAIASSLGIARDIVDDALYHGGYIPREGLFIHEQKLGVAMHEFWMTSNGQVFDAEFEALSCPGPAPTVTRLH